MRPLTPSLALLAAALLIVATAALAGKPAAPKPAARPAAVPEKIEKLQLSDAEWKKRLTPQQYDVLRHAGTERAFTGAYWNEHRKGVYTCAGCDLVLFDANAKFESGTGWPSFFRPAVESHVTRALDTSLGMERDELRCARCGGHLGHVFDDGPPPTGLRYCINSASLNFKPSR